MTKIPQEIITKAVEAGWIPEGYSLKNRELAWLKQAINKVKFQERFALDKNFWIALGKSLGWQEQPYLCTGCQTIGHRESNHMNMCPIKRRSWY